MARVVPITCFRNKTLGLCPSRPTAFMQIVGFVIRDWNSIWNFADVSRPPSQRAVKLVEVIEGKSQLSAIEGQ